MSLSVERYCEVLQKLLLHGNLYRSQQNCQEASTGSSLHDTVAYSIAYLPHAHTQVNLEVS